jgi:inner membrane protein YidH
VSIKAVVTSEPAEPVGTEPDPRLTLANERTFLAWARTGLALIGGGLAVAQAIHFDLGGAHLLIAIPAIMLGAVIGIASHHRWQTNQRAMRLGRPIGYSPLPTVLAIGITVLGLLIAVLTVLSATVR